VNNGGYYSLSSENARKQNLSGRVAMLLGVEDDLSVGPRVLCKKCFRRIERYETTVKELNSFKELYKANLPCWRADGEHSRSKRCSSSPGLGIKKSRGVLGPSPSSAGRNVRRSLIQPTAEKENQTADDSMELCVNPGNVEVVIDYESGRKRRVPKDDVDRKAIKQVVLGEYGYAVNALYSKKVIRDALLEKVRAAVTSECKDLCSVKTPSLLRNTSPTGLKQFSESAHVAELAERAPILYLLLSAAVGKPIPQTAGNHDEENASSSDTDSNKTVPAISMAASVLLKTRCPQMSAQAYRVSTVLWHSGAKKQVYNRGVKWGLTVGHTSAIQKIEQMGKDHDAKVLKWKMQQEHHRKFHATLETITECLEEAVDDEALLHASDSTSACLSSPESVTDLRQEVKEKLGRHFSEAVYSEVELLIKQTTQEETVRNTDVSTVKTLIQQSDAKRPEGYQIIGDNVDLMIKVRHQASDKPNKSIHWFHLNAVKDRVKGAGLSDDGPIRLVNDVEHWEILPSSKDNQDLLHDFIPLFARVISDRIPAFKLFKDVVVRHIPHKYSDVMMQKSDQVPLGLLFKNENANDDMIDI